MEQEHQYLTLPNDIILEILLRSDLDTVLASSQVSKLWFEFAFGSERIWHSLMLQFDFIDEWASVIQDKKKSIQKNKVLFNIQESLWRSKFKTSFCHSGLVNIYYLKGRITVASAGGRATVFNTKNNSTTTISLELVGKMWRLIKKGSLIKAFNQFVPLIKENLKNLHIGILTTSHSCSIWLPSSIRIRQKLPNFTPSAQVLEPQFDLVAFYLHRLDINDLGIYLDDLIQYLANERKRQKRKSKEVKFHPANVERSLNVLGHFLRSFGGDPPPLDAEKFFTSHRTITKW